MATIKTPIRTVYDENDSPTGLAEFQSGEAVGYQNGGTGLSTLGTSGQFIAVKSDLSGFEFVTGQNLATTDELPEGSTNLYYTNERVDDRVASLITAGSNVSVSYDDANGTLTISATEDNLSNNTTDDLAEGSTNQYFTTARVVASISTDNTLSYSSGVVSMPASGVTAGSYGSASLVPIITVDAQGRVTAASTTSVAGVTDFDYNTATGVLDIDTADGQNFSTTVTLGPFDTADLAEGTNLYYTDTRARNAISVTDSGGDGSLSYNSSTGSITYTGPSASEVRAHFSGGTGVNISSGVVSIGQSVGTTDNVTFNNVTVNGVLNSDDITASTMTASGNVIVQGNLTVNGTTTTVNSNTVNIGDSIITLNSDETGAPSQNSGFEVERGTSTNVSFLWDEAVDKWTLGSTTLIASTFEGNLVGNVTGTVSSLSNHDTTDLVEGNNLYYTDARARASVSATGSLSYNSSTGVFSFTQGNTDTVSEGSTNQYFTTTRARSSISASGDLSYNSTTGVVSFTERTDAEVQGLISVSDTGGFGSLSKSGGTITYTGISTEEIQDVVGAMVSTNTESGIAVTYDDTNGKLNFDVSDPTITLTGAVTGSATMTNLGNVTIATTATADPTLTINGDASGSATFTNLGNATLTLTIADDSHNHTIANIDGLQATLDTFIQTDANGDLTINGTVTATNFNTTSDANLKVNVKTIESSRDKVNGLRGVNFNWKNSGDYTMGVIAQEVEEIIPEVVATDVNGKKSVNYQAMVGLLIEAVKDLQAQIDELKSNK